jgi:RNA polymerase sigma factor (sigma-70 family)
MMYAAQPQENNRLEDRSLIEQAINGNQKAFAALIERYRRYVYSIAFKISMHEQDALDITQEVYVRLAEKLQMFDQSGKFSSWLGVLTSRVAIDYIRKVKRLDLGRCEIEDIDEQSYSSTSSSKNPREEAAHQMQLELVQRAMEELSPQQRAVFVLRFREDMRSVDIAEALDIPAKQVRVQIHRAVVKIKKIVHGK